MEKDVKSRHIPVAKMLPFTVSFSNHTDRSIALESNRKCFCPPSCSDKEREKKDARIRKWWRLLSVSWVIRRTGKISYRVQSENRTFCPVVSQTHRIFWQRLAKDDFFFEIQNGSTWQRFLFWQLKSPVLFWATASGDLVHSFFCEKLEHCHVVEVRWCVSRGSHIMSGVHMERVSVGNVFFWGGGWRG